MIVQSRRPPLKRAPILADASSMNTQRSTQQQDAERDARTAWTRRTSLDSGGALIVHRAEQRRAERRASRRKTAERRAPAVTIAPAIDGKGWTLYRDGRAIPHAGIYGSAAAAAPAAERAERGDDYSTRYAEARQQQRAEDSAAAEQQRCDWQPEQVSPTEPGRA